MNQTHLHLLINHLGIIGTILGSLVLAYGIWTNSKHTQLAAYYLFILSAAGAVITYLTGEPAEETVEDISGVSKNMIEQHEEFAIVALIAIIIMAIASVIAIVVTKKNLSVVRSIAWSVLLLSLINFGLIARTGYLGGQIRHTEINSTAVPQHGNDTGGEKNNSNND